MFDAWQIFCSCMSGLAQCLWAILMFFVDMFIKCPILFAPLGITIVGNIIKSAIRKHSHGI